MIFKSKTKEFYIDLESHRYYNPGETVRGDVVLNLSELTRIYHIQVTFTGTVQAANNTLQLFKRECEVATNPNEPGKPHHLEARSHRFPFEFSIPGESAEIPTTMKFSDGSGVKYVLAAVLKKHKFFAVGDSFAQAQDQQEISIVERIDVSLPELQTGGSVHEEVQTEGDDDDPRRVHVAVRMPRFAIARGDVLSVTTSVKHYKSVFVPRAIALKLVKQAYFYGNGRNDLVDKEFVKTAVKDLEISADDNYRYESTDKLLIPPSLPPTTEASGRILRVKYAVQVSVDLNTVRPDHPAYKHNNVIILDVPILIGTTPKPEFSIDDDDDDENEEEVKETVIPISADQQSSLGEHENSLSSPRSTVSSRPPPPPPPGRHNSSQHSRTASRSNSGHSQKTIEEILEDKYKEEEEDSRPEGRRSMNGSQYSSLYSLHAASSVSSSPSMAPGIQHSDSFYMSMPNMEDYIPKKPRPANLTQTHYNPYSPQEPESPIVSHHTPRQRTVSDYRGYPPHHSATRPMPVPVPSSFHRETASPVSISPPRPNPLAPSSPFYITPANPHDYREPIPSPHHPPSHQPVTLPMSMPTPQHRPWSSEHPQGPGYYYA